MPFERVAVLCGASLLVASLCATIRADDPAIANDPFAVPETLRSQAAPNESNGHRSARVSDRSSIANLIQTESGIPRSANRTDNRGIGRASRDSASSSQSAMPSPVIDRHGRHQRRIIQAGGVVRDAQRIRTRGSAGIQLVADTQLDSRSAGNGMAATRNANERGVLVPINSAPSDELVELSDDDGLVFLRTDGADLRSVLRMIAESHGLNLVIGPQVQGPVTVTIRDARLEEVLDAILGVAGYSWHRVDNLLYVTDVAAQGMDPRVQGRSVRVYQLDYVAAADVQQVANGLLSPVGNAFISESDPTDEMRTRETLVVEDIPSAQSRIAEYIDQIDVPPMQVLIEAHVLQIALGEEEKHGIDLRALLRVRGTQLALNGVNFTDPSSSDSDLAVTIDGTDLNGIIQLIRRCTNSRTLASPKVSVVNRQEARIQIGQRLPYSVATTTQTTTVESVEFLEVGIVLTVRPVVTEDGNVLMYVLPKVSGGKITPNGFPEEETTEVQTTIMIPDGGGVVIGGLIREENIQSRAVVPYFHRVPVLGHLFKGKSDEIRRNELVVALVAHVIHNGEGPRLKEVIDLEEALPNHARNELELLPGF